jgi:hypothetical protein
MSTPYPSHRHDVWVVEGYPPVLLTALTERGGVPPAVWHTVLEQLEQRSAAQLRERTERRWFLRFSHLTGPELAQRADELALALVAPGECRDPRCEDGWLLDFATSCPRCRPTRSRFDMREEDVPDGHRSSPARVAQVASGIRAELRRTHGVPRNERSRHVMRSAPAPYRPRPYTLREPEPDLPTPDQVEQHLRMEQDRAIQELAQQRAQADKTARAKADKAARTQREDRR